MWTQLNGHEYAARMGLTKWLISAVVGNRPTTRYLDDPAQGIILTGGRSKISWTSCRIPVRPFVYPVKTGQPPGPKTVTRKGEIMPQHLVANYLIQISSKSSGVKLPSGTIEIRPTADINEMMRESERRR